MPAPRLAVVLHAAPGTSLALTKSEVESELVGKAIRDRPVDWSTSSVIVSEIGVKLDVRFLTATDRNAVYSRITRNQVLNALRSRGFTGVISRHECSHEDAVILDCKSAASGYQERVI